MRSKIKFFIKFKHSGSRSSNSIGRSFKPFYKSIANKKSDVYVWSRSALVTKQFVGKRVSIYNGRNFSSIVVRPTMLGRHFGEFARSKKKAIYAKASKSQGKKKSGKK